MNYYGSYKALQLGLGAFEVRPEDRVVYRRKEWIVESVQYTTTTKQCILQARRDMGMALVYREIAIIKWKKPK